MRIFCVAKFKEQFKRGLSEFALSNSHQITRQKCSNLKYFLNCTRYLLIDLFVADENLGEAWVERSRTSQFEKRAVRSRDVFITLKKRRKFLILEWMITSYFEKHCAHTCNRNWSQMDFQPTPLSRGKIEVA
jgi:hypothetical protein